MDEETVSSTDIVLDFDFDFMVAEGSDMSFVEFKFFRAFVKVLIDRTSEVPHVTCRVCEDSATVHSLACFSEEVYRFCRDGVEG